MIERRTIWLTPLLKKHCKHLFKWWNDSEVMAPVGRPDYSISMPEVERAYDKYVQKAGGWFLILASDEVPIGEISYEVSLEKRTAEIHIKIGERQYWSQGCGADAVNVLVSYIFEHEKNIERVKVVPALGNRRAIRLFEKCVFHKETRSGNAIIMTKTRNE